MSDSDVPVELDFVEVELPAISLIGEELPDVSVEEGVDYVVTEDPRHPEDIEKWAVMILSGEYEDWVVVFSDVVLEGKNIEFKYTIIYHPELPETEFVVAEMANFMSVLINDVVTNMHSIGEGQTYTDADTGEIIDL